MHHIATLPTVDLTLLKDLFTSSQTRKLCEQRGARSMRNSCLVSDLANQQLDRTQPYFRLPRPAQDEGRARRVAHVRTSLDGVAMEAARRALDAAAGAVLARRDCALGVVRLEE